MSLPVLRIVPPPLSIDHLTQLTLKVVLYLRRVESAREKQLYPFQVVVCTILGHIEIMPSAVDHVKEVRKLVDAQPIEVRVDEGIRTHIS